MNLREGEIETWKVGPAIVKGELCELRIPVYRDHGGVSLREARKAKRLGLREAAYRAGLSAVELSDLETGRLVSDDYEAIIRSF